MSLTNYVGWPTFDEMKEMFKEHFIMDRREDGVVLVSRSRLHTGSTDCLPANGNSMKKSGLLLIPL